MPAHECLVVFFKKLLKHLTLKLDWVAVPSRETNDIKAKSKCEEKKQKKNRSNHQFPYFNKTIRRKKKKKNISVTSVSFWHFFNFFFSLLIDCLFVLLCNWAPTIQPTQDDLGGTLPHRHVCNFVMTFQPRPLLLMTAFISFNVFLLLLKNRKHAAFEPVC